MREPVRPIYPHSVIRGGVYSTAELTQAVERDPVVAVHYAGFRASRAHLDRLERPQLAYVSYRVGDSVRWTRKQVPLPAGESVLNDGEHLARARCGNRISLTPQQPVGPADVDLDTPELPPVLDDIPSAVGPSGNPAHLLVHDLFPPLTGGFPSLTGTPPVPGSRGVPATIAGAGFGSGPGAPAPGGGYGGGFGGGSGGGGFPILDRPENPGVPSGPENPPPGPGTTTPPEFVLVSQVGMPPYRFGPPPSTSSTEPPPSNPGNPGNPWTYPGNPEYPSTPGGTPPMTNPPGGNPPGGNPPGSNPPGGGDNNPPDDGGNPPNPPDGPPGNPPPGPPGPPDVPSEPPTEVPEPGTTLLFGGGLLALAVVAKKMSWK